MSAIVLVGQNGVVDEDYTFFDQYGNALNAVLGITDTAQDALGRLVLPRATSFPGSPSQGMASYRTDLGTYGRLHLRDGNSNWVPYLPLRQRAQGASSINFNTSSSSYTDVTNATVTVTTTGGRVRVTLIPDGLGDSYVGLVNVSAGAAVPINGKIKLVMNGFDLGVQYMQFTAAANGVGLFIPVSAFVWEGFPISPFTGGVVKLQALVNAGTVNIAINSAKLMVEELGDS